jgi:MFS family permease
MRSVLGASLLGAAASMPTHVMPFLIAASIADGRLSVAQSGLMASAFIAGLLLSAVALPALGLRCLSRGQALIAAAVLLLALPGALAQNAKIVIGCWLVAGMASGCLYFLANTSAAAHRNKEAAFSLRLCLTLLLSGLVILAMQLAGAIASYQAVTTQMLLALLLLCTVGLVLYQSPASAVSPSAPTAAQTFAPGLVRSKRFVGLGIAFLFFLGQPGFMAYAVQNVQQRGVVLEQAAYALAICKVAAGVLLYFNARQKQGNQSIDGLFFPAVIVVLGVLSMALAPHALMFTLGVLLWELAVNVLSARTQAAVVNHNPQQAGVWLTAAVFLGAAAGPALHGASLQHGVGMAFVAYACVSALIPFAWVHLSARAGRLVT